MIKCKICNSFVFIYYKLIISVTEIIDEMPIGSLLCTDVRPFFNISNKNVR